MDWGLVLGAIGVIGIPVAVGLTMAATTPGEFLFVRGCFIVAAVLALGSFMWLTFEQPLSLSKMMAAGAIGALASIGLTIALAWVKSKEDAALGVTARTVDVSKQAEPVLDNIIQFNCELAQVPTVMPQNKLFELRFYHPGVVAGGAFMSYTTSPGSSSDMSKDAPSYAWLCRVSNFGASSVINVEAEMVVKFRTSGMALGFLLVGLDSSADVGMEPDQVVNHRVLRMGFEGVGHAHKLGPAPGLRLWRLRHNTKSAQSLDSAPQFC